MFLVDTNVISEARKANRADPGVIAFWDDVARNDTPLFLSAITNRPGCWRTGSSRC
jgi:hypothetical protein